MRWYVPDLLFDPGER